ncbi:MAG: DUF4230 domain-containing protein [Clostridia bacterium]|nr:DUF4230 domain-containing protein [Clostridia bacterium]MCR4904950.1 DUF4230 domain-containing protein [Clostridiales bacterium]
MIRKLNSRRSVILLAAIAVVFLGIVAVVIWGTAVDAADTAVTQSPSPAVTQNSAKGGKKILDVEQEIMVKTLEEGVTDMGVLVTQEYYFTDAVTQSKVKTLFSIPLGFTETSYVATYDGVVTAGLDFTRIRIALDIMGKTVTVRMPKAEIQNVDIDPNSFVLYSEKNGFGNPLSISEFNGSIVELENKAKNRAVERGLLEQADENARRVVSNFIGGFLDLTKYDILWESE